MIKVNMMFLNYDSLLTDAALWVDWVVPLPTSGDCFLVKILILSTCENGCFLTIKGRAVNFYLQTSGEAPSKSSDEGDRNRESACLLF